MGVGRIIYNTIFYLLAAVVLAASLYVAWRYVSSERNWGDLVEWNFWESKILYPILCIIGFFLQFTIKHSSNITVITDSWGNKTYFEDNPGCFVELVSYLFLVPCLIGMVLYYAIMVPFVVISTFIPYLAAAASVGIAVLFVIVAKGFEEKSFSIVRLVFAVLFTLSILYAMALPTDLRIVGTTVTTETGPTSLGKIKVIAQMANLRTGPGTKYSICKREDGSKLTAKRGEHYDVLAIEGGWYKVVLPNGETAYISKSLCTKLDLPDLSKGTTPKSTHSDAVESGGKASNAEETTSLSHTDRNDLYFEEGNSGEVKLSKRLQLHLVVKPDNHDEILENPKSTNEEVAVVSRNGKTYYVTPKKPGECTISVKSSRTGKVASFKVLVKEDDSTRPEYIDVERMYFEEGVMREVNAGDRFELHLVAEPANHDEEIGSPQWTKDVFNNTVAVVSKIDNKTYLVKTMRPGVCTITVSSSRTNETASFKVRVK